MPPQHPRAGVTHHCADPFAKFRLVTVNGTVSTRWLLTAEWAAGHALAIACDVAEERRMWLSKAAAEGHLDAMHCLAHEVAAPAERQRWLLRAAQEGPVPAMRDLSATSEDPAERERWLQEAARNGCHDARVQLWSILARPVRLMHLAKFQDYRKIGWSVAR
jgi:hypothetical protein